MIPPFTASRIGRNTKILLKKKNWVKVDWQDSDKAGRATGTSKVYAAQVVRFGATRDDLVGLYEEMLATRGGAPSTKQAVRKVPKKKGDSLEDKVMKRLKFQLQEQKLAACKQVPQKEGTTPTTLQLEQQNHVQQGEERAEEAEEQAKQADERAKQAEERAKQAEERVQLAEERAQLAEERAQLAEERAQLAEEQVDQLEEKVQQADTRATFAVLALLPCMQELPQLVRALQQLGVGANQLVVHQGAVADVHKFGDILVPSTKLELLRGKGASVYTQELAVLVFGSEALKDNCLTGSSSKAALPKAAVDDIVAHVMEKFNNEDVTSVRRYLARKCNNESSKKKDANE